MFIPCFYVSLNSKNPCSIWCTLFIYIFNKKNFQKKSRFPNLSQKKKKKKKKEKKEEEEEEEKEKNFKWESVWTRGIGPWSHLKKKNLWTRAIELPSDFFKKTQSFFSFKIKKKKKNLLFKMVHKDPLDKTFSKS